MSVGPWPQDDSHWTTPLIGPLARPQVGIANAPTLSSQATNNLLNTPASISGLVETPPTTLQAQINATTSGGILYVTPGYIYRESVTISNPITIVARGMASLRGTDDWSTGGVPGNTWTLASGVYTSSLTIPTMTTDATQGTPTDTYSQNHREQVFSDGVGIRLVNAAPVGQQWQIDGSRHVVLGFNPAGHKIEVATRNTVITLNGNNDFTLDGLDIRQVATSGTIGGVQAINSSGITTAKFRILNCMIGWCHGAALNPGGMTAGNILVEGSIFHDCGTAGLAGSSNTNSIIRRNIFFNCGLPLYGWDPGFGSGGSKFAGCDGTLYDSNVAFCNKGAGLWLDILCTHGVFRDNVVWDTYGAIGGCIQYEVSSFGVIRDNIVFRTPNQPGGLNGADLGIFISNSRWVDCYGNQVMHCPLNIKYFWAPSRTDSPPTGSQDNTHMGGVTIHGNRIIGRYHATDQSNNSDLAIQWSDDGTGTYSTNVTSNTGGVIAGTSLADGDVYGYPALINNGTNSLEVQQEPDGRWRYDPSATTINTIANWQTAVSSRLGPNSRYMLDADRVAQLRRFGLTP